MTTARTITPAVLATESRPLLGGPRGLTGAGLEALLLHCLVLSMFIESVGVGPARVGRVLAVLVAVFFSLALMGRRSFRRIPRRAWVPGAAYFMWALASGFWSGAVSAWLASVAGLALAALYFAAFAFLPRSPAQVQRLTRTFLLGATAAGLLALAQSRSGVRAVGLQGDPNIFALYQGAAVPVALVLSRSTPVKLLRLMYSVAAAVLVLSVLASQSRGGLLILVVVLAFSVIRGDIVDNPIHRVTLLVAVALAVVVVAPTLAERVAPRLSASAAAEDRGSGRLDIWRASLGVWAEHPLLGIGGGNFQPQSRQLLQTTPGVEVAPGSALLTTGIKVHNVYLESLVEYGPVGLSLWLLVLGTCIYGLSRSRVARGRDPCFDALLPMLVAFCVGTVLISANNSKLLWLLVGLQTAFPPLTSRPRRVPPTLALEGFVPKTSLDTAEPAKARQRTNLLGDRARSRRDALMVLFVSVPLLFGLSGAGLTSLMVTHYRATSVLLVPPGSSRADNETVVRTIQSLIVSPPLAQDIATQSGLDLTVADVQDRTTVERPPDSSLLIVTVEDPVREQAVRLSAAVGPSVAKRLMGVRDRPGSKADLTAFTVVPVTTTDQITVIKPPVRRNAALAFVLGSLVALGLAAASVRAEPREQARP